MKMDWLGYRSDSSKCCTNKHLSDARCLFSLSLSLSLSLGFPRLTLDFPVDVSVDFGLVMLTSPTYLDSPFHSLVCFISYWNFLAFSLHVHVWTIEKKMKAQISRTTTNFCPKQVEISIELGGWKSKTNSDAQTIQNFLILRNQQIWVKGNGETREEWWDGERSNFENLPFLTWAFFFGFYWRNERLRSREKIGMGELLQI